MKHVLVYNDKSRYINLKLKIVKEAMYVSVITHKKRGKFESQKGESIFLCLDSHS